jgi:hypothetical protein
LWVTNIYVETHYYAQVFRVSIRAEGPFGKSLSPAVVTGPIFLQVAYSAAHFLGLVIDQGRIIPSALQRRVIGASLFQATFCATALDSIVSTVLVASAPHAAQR